MSEFHLSNMSDFLGPPLIPSEEAKESYKKGSSVFIAAALATALFTQGIVLSALFKSMASPDQPAVTALATEAQKNTQDKAIALDTTNMKSILTTFAPK